MDLLDSSNLLSPLNPISPLNPMNQMNMGLSSSSEVAACVPDAANNFCQLTGFEIGLVLVLSIMFFGFIIWFVSELYKD